MFAGEGVAHEGANVAHGEGNVAHEGGDVAHEEEGDTPELDDFIRSEIRQNATVTREEIAKSAGVSKKTVERHLAKMSDVRYVGSGSNGHWEILDRMVELP